jgi:hypothetical protein
MKMSMPGFRAEASLYATNGRYAAAPARGAATGQLVPQLQGDLALSNSCTAACRCCRWGNRFCCSHCRWCSGPIGPISSGLELSS